MNESIEAKRPKKRPAAAVKSKSGGKLPKTTSGVTKRQALGSVEHIKKINVIVDVPDRWKPLEATVKAAKSIWEWFREKMALILGFTARSIRRVVWLPL